MDCDNMMIQFNPIGHPRFEFQGNQGGTSIPWISSLEATKMLDEGCEGYLMNVNDSTLT